MGADSNIVMKKLLQKLVDRITTSKKYSDLSKVEVFFTFGSAHKTAMCQWVYGLKIHSKKRYGRGSDLIHELQREIRRNTDATFKQSVCLTDLIFDENQ